MKQKRIAAFIAAVLTANCIGMQYSQRIHAGDSADSLHCTYYSGTNIGRQNYNYFTSLNSAKTNASALVALADGRWMRVQGEVSGLGQTVLVEYYDADFDLLERKNVPMVLPVFGCFYEASDGYYYLVTGQKNVNEKADVAVFDIAKYTTDWELVGHDQLCGANTAIPFDAGCARCVDDGKYLVVRTSHEMFNGNAYQGHQANVTIEFDMDTMEITDDSCAVSSLGVGYVSHSFNQFILMDGTQLVALDHGDCYPRSVVLNKYNTDYTTGKFKPDYSTRCTEVDMFTYGEMDAKYRNDMSYVNYTGVAVGGFEQSSTHYLAALNTIDQDNWEDCATNYFDRTGSLYAYTRNIVVSAVPKDDLDNANVQQYQITDYAEGEATAHNPHLTPIGSDSFMLLWQQDKTVYYVVLDNTGAPISEIYSMEGEISDCEPVCSNSKLYWYTWADANVTFHSIDVTDPSKHDSVVYYGGHDYHLDEEPDENGILHDTCSKCGDVVDHTVPTAMRVLPYRKVSSGVLSTWNYADPQTTQLDAGEQISMYISSMSPSGLNQTDKQCVSEIVDGADAIQVVTDNDFYGNPIYQVNDFEDENKTFTISIHPVYNPSLTETFTFTTGHHYAVPEIVEPTDEKDGYIHWECTKCGYTKTEVIQKFAAKDGSSVTPVLSQDSLEYNHSERKPTVSLTLTDPETGEETTLTAGTDFTVRYINNVNAGTATAIVTATADSDKLTGTMFVPFTITPQSLGDATCIITPGQMDVEAPETNLYDAARPTLKFYDKQGYRIQPEDYYIKGAFIFDEDCLHLDYIDFAIHAQAQNYTGGIEKYYNIPLIDLSEYQAVFENEKLAETGEAEYSGSAQNPSVSVTTSKGRVLEPDVDYIVTYEDTTEVGTATVTIQGIGYYEGEITLHFDIVPEKHPAPPAPVYGDLDGDGELSKEDAVSLTEILTGESELSEEAMEAADFNHDDTVNVLDLTLMKQQILQQANQ